MPETSSQVDWISVGTNLYRELTAIEERGKRLKQARKRRLAAAFQFGFLRRFRNYPTTHVERR
jgi:hypothetical protein